MSCTFSVSYLQMLAVLQRGNELVRLALGLCSGAFSVMCRVADRVLIANKLSLRDS
jgi:hypothetical protein